MKLRFVYIIAMVVGLALQVRADNLGYSKDHPLLFGVDMDYAPLQWVDGEGMPHGYDVDFTKELLKRLNIPFTYSPNTWMNISGDVLGGRVDLGMMVYSPYRKNITNYSRALFRLYYQIVYRETDKGNFDMRNLGGKHIAYMSSRPLTDTLTHMGAVVNVVKDLPKAVVDLSNGKYDAVVCFRFQARYLLDKFQLKNLVTEDLTLTPREYCYVSQNKTLINLINQEITKMESEGIIDDVYGETVVASDFKIPAWVWYLLVGLVILFLVAAVFVQRQHQKVLRREMERAQRSESLKTVFLGNVTHALRTPLNAIIGFSDVMRSAPEGAIGYAEQQQMLEHINKNGQQLLYFINELLQLSNFEGNELLFDRAEVSLHEIMNAYVTETKLNVKDGVELKQEGTDCRILVDEKLMRLVTKHFLDNAAKHTAKGSITLKYGPADGGLRVEVKDTGSGLPESLKENIFGLLSDKNTYVQDEVPGLGLSICKAVVERSGGNIGAESPAGGGTTFWYWVPVKVMK